MRNSPSGTRHLCSFLLLCGAMAGGCGAAHASESSLSTTTVIHAFSRESPLGPNLTYAPLYEIITVDSWEAGRKEISLHGNAWGRIDLGDETGDGKTGGSLESAYLAYDGDVQARVGRFFVTEGACVATIDGVLVKTRSALGLGASLFAGRSPQDAETSRRDIGLLSGGRLSYARSGLLDLGVTYLQGRDQLADGGDRREMGADLWFRPGRALTLSGESVYNRVTSRTARTKAAATVSPSRTLTVTAGAEDYSTVDLLDSALNPAFSLSLLGDDEVATVFASVQWQASERLAITAGGRKIGHLLADPGDATRGEIRARLDLGAGLLAGLGTARQSADLPENAYSEVRGYFVAPRGPWSFSLDALAMTYDEPIAGESSTYQVVGSAGRRFGRSTKVSADARLTSSPTYKEDVSLLLRIEMETDR